MKQTCYFPVVCSRFNQHMLLVSSNHFIYASNRNWNCTLKNILKIHFKKIPWCLSLVGGQHWRKLCHYYVFVWTGPVVWVSTCAYGCEHVCVFIYVWLIILLMCVRMCVQVLWSERFISGRINWFHDYHWIFRPVCVCQQHTRSM